MSLEINAMACRNVGEVLKRVGDRWSILIIITLSGGSRRFSALRRDIPDISQRMLARTLRGLERDGMVTRTVTPSVPLRVDYALTSLGASLREPVEALGQWALDHGRDIRTAQDMFDRQESVAS